MNSSAELRRAVQLTIEDLQDDFIRKKEALDRSAVDALYLKRGIKPEEAVIIEKALTCSGVEIEEASALLPEPTDKDVEAAGISNSALDHLMKQARGKPFLTHQDEQRLGRAIQRGLQIDPEATDEISQRILNAAEDARAELITCNVRLVVKVAWDRRFRGRLDADDLVQMGLIGLMRAAEKFDPAWETRFSTYAVWWIRQAMSRGIANHSTTIRIPVHIRQAISHYKRAAHSIDSTAPNQISKIATKLGWTEEYTAKVATFAEQKTVSLDAPIFDNENIHIKDTIIDKNLSPEQSLFEKDISEKVKELLTDLDDDRLEDIIYRRFGIYGRPETLEEIGQDYGVTRERIRQLEVKALRKLKNRKMTRHLAQMLFQR